MRGRKPKTRNAPTLLPDAPTAPDELDEDGMAEWKRLSAVMKSRGTLSVEFESAMLIYCATYSMWIKAQRSIKERGMVYDANGLMKANPSVKVAQQFAPTLRSLLTDLCLTPASRSRIGSAAPQEKDEFAEFLARSSGK